MGRLTLAGLLGILLCLRPPAASGQQLPTSPLSGLSSDELLVLWDFLQSGIVPSSPPPLTAAPPASAPAPPITAPSTATPPSSSPSLAPPGGTASSSDGALPLTVASITSAISSTLSSLSASLPRLGAWLTNWGTNVRCVHYELRPQGWRHLTVYHLQRTAPRLQPDGRLPCHQRLLLLPLPQPDAGAAGCRPPTTNPEHSGPCAAARRHCG